MLNVENFKDAILKILLLVPAALVFLATTGAFGHVVFGVLASAFYVYEVARI
ncbi:MAG: hypothetical protein MJY82_06400 [Fibrobacter sp.]|nr:hypothetical protein [Fibrobacter sp.]